MTEKMIHLGSVIQGPLGYTGTLTPIIRSGLSLPMLSTAVPEIYCTYCLRLLPNGFWDH